MKTKMNRWQIDFENQAARPAATHHSKFTIRHFPAFTLIELLVVISIIAILAAFTLPVLKSLKRNQFIKQTQAEMAQLETALDSYKAAYGFYPPGNPNSPFFNPLYFELLGTTTNYSTTAFYKTLDGSASINLSAFTTATPPLGVSGFVNCTRGSGEDATAAKNFLPELKPKQIGLNITNPVDLADPVALLLGAVAGPDPNYLPLNNAPGINPWRYACPGTNNPNSYDLWIQLSIGGTTNLVCNWGRQIQQNTTLP
jgi:prepilin-type N-terminal cleavage/methylation domain-containing protein